MAVVIVGCGRGRGRRVEAWADWSWLVGEPLAETLTFREDGVHVENVVQTVDAFCLIGYWDYRNSLIGGRRQVAPWRRHRMA